MTELRSCGRRLMAIVLVLAIAACSGVRAAFVTNSNPSLRSLRKGSRGAAGQEFRSATDDATLTLAGAAGVAGLVTLAASSCKARQAPKKAKVTVLEAQADPAKAMKDFFKPRKGKALQRDLPPNAEEFGTISIIYQVSIKKPLGLQLVTMPDNTGCGVNGIDDGNAFKLFEDYMEGKSANMYIQEGDTIESVNGTEISGFDALETAAKIIGETPEDQPVRLTLSRKRLGPIKVVFPNGAAVTVPRMTKLSQAAEAAGYDSGCNSKEGRDEKCWFKDAMTGEVYVLPLSVPGLVPSVLRKKGIEVAEREGVYECWIPLILLPAPEEYGKALIEEQKYQDEMRAQGLTGRGFQ